MKTEKSIPNRGITVFRYLEELKENITAAQMIKAFQITRNFEELSNRFSQIKLRLIQR